MTSHLRPRASILHADLDSFYASVEQRDNPRLRGRPVLVGGGVVLAASYEAKAFGVVTPMGIAQARRRCPHAVVVPPRMEAYAEASRAVFAIFHDTTPLVEPISIDEAFLDVGGLTRVAGSPLEIGARLRQRIASEVGLAITVGIARTKFLAKVASGVGKPDGLLRVDPDDEQGFLHPLPVTRLWGVGPVTAAKLERVDLRTVGEVAALPLPVLVGLVGTAAGHKLHHLSRLEDPRPVQGGRRRSSIGSQQAMRSGSKSHDELRALLGARVDKVTSRLRAADRVARTVVVRFRFDDFTRATRSRSLPQATADTEPINRAAQDLLSTMMPTIAARGLSLIGLTAANLSDSDAVQLALPFDDRSGLDTAMDSVRDRFGHGALERATNLGRDTGVGVPMVPD